MNSPCRSARNRRTSGAARRLIKRHHLQIIAQEQHPDLVNAFAITFLPRRPSNTFHGKTLERIGINALVVMSYESDPSNPRRFCMPLRGFRGKAQPDGSVCYGGDAGCLFHYDGALHPRYGEKTGAIIADRRPTLVDLVLRLDRACKARVDRGKQPILVPKLPRIVLGFVPNEPPSFEDSPALRRLAARELRMPVDRLGSNGQVLLDRLLRDIWQRQLILPDAPDNPTDKLLLDAEFCTQARGALEIYEDFSELVGLHVWNPIREVQLLETQNPAREVLQRHNVDVNQNFNQFFPDELIEQLEMAMRGAIGPSQRLFTTEEILDGLTAPGNPLVGYKTSLPKLRSRLSAYVSECTTDDDLLRAAHHPDKPLLASGACRIQVVANEVSDGHARQDFSGEILRRRVKLDLSVEACVVWSSLQSACDASGMPSELINVSDDSVV